MKIFNIFPNSDDLFLQSRTLRYRAVNVEQLFLENNVSGDNNLLQHNILFVVNDSFSKLMGKMFLQEKELGNLNTRPQKSITLSTALEKKREAPSKNNYHIVLVIEKQNKVKKLFWIQITVLTRLTSFPYCLSLLKIKILRVQLGLNFCMCQVENIQILKKVFWTQMKNVSANY